MLSEQTQYYDLALACKNHGAFTQRAVRGLEHLSSTECPECKREQMATHTVHELMAEFSSRVVSADSLDIRGLELTAIEKKLGIQTKAWRECTTHGRFVATQRKEVWSEQCPHCRLKDSEQQALLAREETLRKAQEAHVERLLGQSMLPLRFADSVFADLQADTPEERRAVATCQAFAETFPEVCRKSAGLIIIGTTGTGKTRLGCTIANHVLREHGKSVLFSSVSTACSKVKECWSKQAPHSEREIYRAYITPDLLVLDEVGMQYGSDTEKNILFEIINQRYEKLRPTILSGNVDRTQLEACLGARILDRMREGGKLLVLDGPSRRAEF